MQTHILALLLAVTDTYGTMSEACKAESSIGLSCDTASGGATMVPGMIDTHPGLMPRRSTTGTGVRHTCLWKTRKRPGGFALIHASITRYGTFRIPKRRSIWSKTGRS